MAFCPHLQLKNEKNPDLITYVKLVTEFKKTHNQNVTNIVTVIDELREGQSLALLGPMFSCKNMLEH